jgi:hypothetical protein
VIGLAGGRDSNAGLVSDILANLPQELPRPIKRLLPTAHDAPAKKENSYQLHREIESYCDLIDPGSPLRNR